MTIFVVNQRLLLLPVLMVIVGDVLLGIEYIDPTSGLLTGWKSIDRIIQGRLFTSESEGYKVSALKQIV